MPLFRFFSSLALPIILAAPAWAQGGHGHQGGSTTSGHHMDGHHGGGPGNFPGAGHVINYNPGIFVNYGVGGGYAYSPSLFVFGQSWGPPGLPPVPFIEPTGLAFNLGGAGAPGGLMLPSPPREFSGQAATRPRRPNPARARELVELGDRSFRGDNTRRAEDRYQQAIKADPAAVAPHVHLAQIALIRGHYTEAADHLRSAVATGAGSGWLANAPDVQSMFSEPGGSASSNRTSRPIPATAMAGSSSGRSGICRAGPGRRPMSSRG